MVKTTAPLWFKLLAKDRTSILMSLLIVTASLPTQRVWKYILLLLIALIQLANLSVLYLIGK